MVIELLKQGPLTQHMVRVVKNLRATICYLRSQGWPILTEMRPYWTKFGQRVRAEYRLGDWRQRELPLVDSNKLKQPVVSTAGTETERS